MTLRKEALAFLREGHTEAGGDLATAFALTVLRGAAELPGEWTRLALDIRAAHPNWAAKAVSLAALALDETVQETVSQPDHGKRGGGQR